MSDETTPTAPAPHVRAGAIVYGLITIAIGSGILWASAEPSRREAVADWVTSLTPQTAAIVGVLALGGILVLAGLLAGIRRLQRR